MGAFSKSEMDAKLAQVQQLYSFMIAPADPSADDAESPPSPPPGAIAWWKGYTNLFEDAGITPAENDNDVVYRMADNIASHHADQSSATLRPILKLNQMPSGEAALRFDGSNDVLVATLDGTTLVNLTIGFLFKPISTEGGVGLFQWAADLSSGTPFILVQRNGTDVRFYFNNGYRFTIPHAANEFKSYVLSYNGTTWNLMVDGIAETPYVGGTFFQNKADALYFGNGFNGYSNQDVGEVIVYDSVADAASLSTYLMTIGGL